MFDIITTLTLISNFLLITYPFNVSGEEEVTEDEKSWKTGIVSRNF